jgi:hypothetical protein
MEFNIHIASQFFNYIKRLNDIRTENGLYHAPCNALTPITTVFT